MSITETARSLCNKLASEFDKQIVTAKNQMINTNRTVLYDVILELGRTDFTNPTILDTKINGFRTDVRNTLPGSSKSDVETFISNTGSSVFLSTNDIYKDPISIKRNLLNSLNAKINELVSVLGETIPEFNIGAIINALQISFSLDGLGISNLIYKAQNIISDLTSAICGDEFTSDAVEMQQELDSLCDDIYMIKNPLDPDYLKLDTSGIYTAAGMTSQQISNMNSTLTSITDSQSDVKSSVNSCSEAVKDYLFS